MIGRNKKTRECLKERREESVGVFMLSLPIALFLLAGRMMTVGKDEGSSFAELLAAFDSLYIAAVGGVRREKGVDRR
jgi:hypothetical protein